MIEFHRTAVSIHQDTFSVLNNRTTEMGRNLSWVCDSALTRYFSLMEQASKKLEDKFTEQEINAFSQALKKNFSNLRNLRIPQLRMMVRGMEEEAFISKELSHKILEELSSDEFLAFLDLSEKKIRKAK